jgi:transcription elongation GreA/GreB family factor
MSRAFVKEPDGGEPPEPLPDRPISPHPNFVTPEGLAKIDTHLEELRDKRAVAQAAEDRVALAQIARDARYWAARRASAQVVNPPSHPSEVAFGTTVTLARDDGRRQTYRIVGEDEGDPARGALSYVAPLARDLIGKGVGDVVRAGNAELEIVEIK